MPPAPRIAAIFFLLSYSLLINRIQQQTIPSYEIRPTKERQGIVPLHSSTLGDSINRRGRGLRELEIKDGVKEKERFEAKFSTDVKYLCEGIDLILPILPFSTEAENKKFDEVIRSNNGSFNDDKYCLDWIRHCNGKDIFPKHSFYMRAHHEKWKKNNAARKKFDSQEHKDTAALIARINEDSSAGLQVEEAQLPRTMQTATPVTHNEGNSGSEAEAVPVTMVAGINVAPNLNVTDEQLEKKRKKPSYPSKRKARVCAICNSASCPGKVMRDRCIQQNAT
jgi:hypothetical protein